MIHWRNMKIIDPTLNGKPCYRFTGEKVQYSYFYHNTKTIEWEDCPPGIHIAYLDYHMERCTSEGVLFKDIYNELGALFCKNTGVVTLKEQVCILLEDENAAINAANLIRMLTK